MSSMDRPDLSARESGMNVPQRREPSIHEEVDRLLKQDEANKYEKRELLSRQAYKAYNELSIFRTVMNGLSASSTDQDGAIRQFLEWMQAEFNIEVPDVVATEILRDGV